MASWIAGARTSRRPRTTSVGPPLANKIVMRDFIKLSMHRHWYASLLLAFSSLVAGCSSMFAAAPPAQYEPTKLDISIEAASGLNPDDRGRAAPILLRVYELRSDNAFQEADFFSLQGADKATLSGDLLIVDQFILRPGETRSIRRRSHPESKAIGVFAGYRDLPNASWRAVYKVPPAAEAAWYRALMPNNTISLLVMLQANAVLVTDRRNGDTPPGAKEQLDPRTSPPQAPAPNGGIAQHLDGMKKAATDAMNSVSSMPTPTAVQGVVRDPLGSARQLVGPR